MAHGWRSRVRSRREQLGLVALSSGPLADEEVAWLVRAGFLATLALVGCDEPAADDTLTVFAASSLTDAFEELSADFEGAHDGVDVAPSFAGTQVLRLQIEQGAPADVFASADRRHVDALVGAGLVRDARVFATNELCVIVPRANPADIERFEDLRRAPRIVIGDANVPVGRYTRQLLARADAHLGAGFAADVRARVVSEENNVRLVRAKVELGEVDAAIVYRTDAASSDRVHVVEVPDALAVRAHYYLGVVAASERQELARRWIAHVKSEAGRRALARHGFVTDEPR